jgi:NAD(P)-dependent dehydrogenase (short-subunit alcohol dehydrogenase family)
MNEQRPVAIVTGASSGIGAAVAEALARRGYLVALAARREHRLRQVAETCRTSGGEGLVVVTDVAEPQQVERLVEGVHDRCGRIDVLVNNAGIGETAAVHETDPATMRRVFEVNYFGLFLGCRAVARRMIARGQGHIFNVSSVLGRRGSPMHGAYCASKFAILGLTDSMRVELLPHGVHVTSVCPATTDTEFFDGADEPPDDPKTLVGRLRRRMDPAIVARRMVQCIGRHTPQLTFSAGGKIMAYTAALAPGVYDRLMGVYREHLASRSRRER